MEGVGRRVEGSQRERVGNQAGLCETPHGMEFDYEDDGHALHDIHFDIS